MNFTSSLIAHSYNITLKASDSYSKIYKSYQLQTQTIVNFNLSTNPSNPSIINDNSNKKIKY